MKKNNRLLETIKQKRLYFDGGLGSLLQGMGLQPGERPELWSITKPEKLEAVHRAYYEAGCNLVVSNTFGVNREKYENYEELIEAGINCVKAAAGGKPDRFAGFDMGPLGKMLEPIGSCSFEEAVSIFADNVKAAVKSGADFIIIETMNDAYETKAAVVAAKENSDLPIFVSNAYDERGRLMTGATPGAMIAMLEGLGVDALGMNCSFGPDKLLEIMGEFEKYASVPVIVMPNAGLPEMVNGKMTYNIDAERFSEYMVEIAQKGGTLLGGCCGTTPEYMRKMIEKVEKLPYRIPEKKNYTMVSSYSHEVVMGESPVLIGERINPTGKPKLKEALKTNNMEYILTEGIRQDEAGVHILDVNVGLPEIDEPKMMKDAVRALQSVSDLPLQIDTSDPEAMEAGMRIYNGKPLVNSVNGKSEVMDSIFPIVKKYGGTVIALTIGEDGIPDTAEGRFNIAMDIIKRASEYGIDSKDIIVDPLAMTISSNQKGARVALEVVKKLSEMGIKTSMGVSNISFGLPERDMINSVFFANALERGMNCAIMNPFSEAMMDVYYAFRALNCMDENCLEYIGYAERKPEKSVKIPSGAADNSEAVSNNRTAEDDAANCGKSALFDSILKGMKKKSAEEAAKLVNEEEPLNIINNHIVPSLNEIGKAFEEGKAYLPQLLLSAEAASGAFEVVREKLPKKENDTLQSVILATVKGDIHDIGKNIVKVLLQSYGFNVIDLGKDVSPETIRDKAVETGCCVVGLSALMTTTVPAMKDTISLLRKTGKDIRVIVGGAVLNEDYSKLIGADKYSPDAMDTVRFAREYYGN